MRFHGWNLSSFSLSQSSLFSFSLTSFHSCKSYNGRLVGYVRFTRVFFFFFISFDFDWAVFFYSARWNAGCLLLKKSCEINHGLLYCRFSIWTLWEFNARWERFWFIKNRNFLRSFHLNDVDLYTLFQRRGI